MELAKLQLVDSAGPVVNLRTRNTLHFGNLLHRGRMRNDGIQFQIIAENRFKSGCILGKHLRICIR